MSSKNVIERVALKKHQCDTLAEKVSFLVIGYYYQRKVGAIRSPTASCHIKKKLGQLPNTYI